MDKDKKKGKRRMTSQSSTSADESRTLVQRGFEAKERKWRIALGQSDGIHILLDVLPSRVLRRILLYLNLLDTFNFAQVSRRFAALCEDQELWRRKFRLDWGSSLRNQFDSQSPSSKAAASFDWKNLYMQYLHKARDRMSLRSSFRRVVHRIQAMNMLTRTAQGDPLEHTTSTASAPDLLTSYSPPSSPSLLHSSRTGSPVCAPASSPALSSGSRQRLSLKTVATIATSLPAQRKSRPLASRSSTSAEFGMIVDRDKARKHKESKKRKKHRLSTQTSGLVIVTLLVGLLFGAFFLIDWDFGPAGLHPVSEPPTRTGELVLPASFVVALSNNSDTRDDRFCNEFDVIGSLSADNRIGKIVRSETPGHCAFYLLGVDGTGHSFLNASLTGSKDLLRIDLEYQTTDANGTLLASIDEHFRPGFFVDEYWAEFANAEGIVQTFVPRGDHDRGHIDLRSSKSGELIATLRRTEVVKYLFWHQMEYRWIVKTFSSEVDRRILALFAAKIIAVNLIDEDHDDDDSSLARHLKADDDDDEPPEGEDSILDLD